MTIRPDMGRDPTYLLAPAGAGNPLAYRPRLCTPLGRGNAHGIAYKTYAMRSERFSAEDIPARLHIDKAVAEALSGWDAPGDHPAAFAILHLANDGVYLLVSRWNDANNIRHRVFATEISADCLSLRPLADPFTIACIWETRLIAREVTYWINAVLARARGALTKAMLEDYLALQFEGEL
jgi:hypothetical protein